MGGSVAEKDEILREELDDIDPNVAYRTQVLGRGEATRSYTQKPLSFFGKLQFFEVLGRAIEQAMTGDDALSLNTLFAGPSVTRQADGGITVTDVEDADTFVRGIAKVAMYAPDMLADLYCIFLNVPVGERAWAKATMALSDEDGGLSDDDGIAILETFFAQNAGTMRDFFVERLMPLLGKLREKFDAPEKASSTRSKTTRRTTPKALRSS